MFLLKRVVPWQKRRHQAKANLVGLIKLKNAAELTEYAQEVREKARTDIDS